MSQDHMTSPAGAAALARARQRQERSRSNDLGSSSSSKGSPHKNFTNVMVEPSGEPGGRPDASTTWHGGHLDTATRQGDGVREGEVVLSI